MERCGDLQANTASDAYDLRYKKVEGIETTEYDVYNKAGLFDLFGTYRSFQNNAQSFKEQKKLHKYHAYIRPTINWSTNCDINGQTRQKAFEVLNMNVTVTWMFD